MERQVTITATPSKVKTISVNKATVANEITATPDTSLYYSNLSKQWATKMDGLVVGEDYSSKYYAENARVHAETAKMEASTTTELKNLLKEDFDGYTESLNNTKNLAIEEINTTSTVAIGNLNTVVTSSTGQINTVAKEQTELVASTANKALEDIETLVTNSTDVIESLSENSTEEINTLGNTIKSDATDWIDVINATGKSYNMVTHRQITNCITEIPQDIKLELNDGVLTLKAGSKVYVPNGFDGSTPKFNEVVTDTDITLTSLQNRTGVLYYSGGKIYTEQFDRVYSGATYTGGQYGLWYNTTNNQIGYTGDTGANWSYGKSLPLAICTVTENGVTSIDQIFNGFGYIGSTAFVLPNVKGLIPNGRNEDGSLNNIECSFSKVVTQTNTVQYSGNIALQTDNFDLAAGDYYDEETNYNRLSDGRIFSRCVAGKFVKGANGVITSFTPKQPFRAVDYSDKPEVVSWSIPDYTKGINQSIDTTYTANHDGYITFCNTSGYDDTRYTLTLIYNGVTNSWQFGHSSNAMDNGCAWINYPVPKGSQYKITKDGGGSAYQMIFFPMKGAN